MGTDIHGRIQFRYSDDGGYVDAGEIERDRNYNVFAMLAGVRNGCGFAGIKTHYPLVPISEPRGLPSDLGIADVYINIPAGWNDDGSEKFIEYWLGDHSHSWLSLTEINAWGGWSKQLSCTGVITADEFKRIESEGGTPNNWSGDVRGGNTVIVSPDDARSGVPHTHVRYEWAVPFTQYTRSFKAWLDYMMVKHEWRIERDPEAVRIVFGFDS